MSAVITPTGRAIPAGRGVIDEVEALEVWERLTSDPAATPKDIRTRAKWTFVDIPERAALGKWVAALERQTAATPGSAPASAQKSTAALAEAGAGQDAGRYFIRWSGSRSRMTEEARASKDLEHFRHVFHGFEWPLDAERRRSNIGRRITAGTAWAQG